MLRGVVETWRSPAVRQSYRLVPLAIVLVTLAISGLGIGGLLHISDRLAHFSEGAQWIRSLLTWVIGLVILLAAPLLAFFVFNLLFPLFADRPFLAGVREIDADKARAIECLPGLSLTSSLIVSLRRMLRLLPRLAVCFLLSLIPVAGPVIAPPLSVYVLAKGTGWELLDPYFDRKSYNYGRQLQLITGLRWEVFGLGLVCLPVLAIPFIGPLFFGVLQAGVARFTIEMFAQEQQPAPGLSQPPSL